MKRLLFIILLFATLTSLAQQSMNRGSGSGGSVTLPYTTVVTDAISLSNACLAVGFGAGNGRTIIIKEGTGLTTYSNWGGLYTSAKAPYELHDVTNLTLIAESWGAQIYHTNVGDSFRLMNCQNVTFRGIHWQSARQVEPIVNSTLWAFVNLAGTNNGIKFDGCWFDTISDHGVAALTPNTGNSQNSNVVFTSCNFYWVGSSNWQSIGWNDGVCIGVAGPNWTIANNTFQKCNRGIEVEGPAANSIFPDYGTLTISGNTVTKQFGEFALLSQTMPIAQLVFTGNNIELDGLSHIAKAFQSPGEAATSVMSNAVIAANIINARGQSLSGDIVVGQILRNAVIADNIILGGVNGIDIRNSGSQAGRDLVIRGNIIRDAQGGMYIDGISDVNITGNNLHNFTSGAGITVTTASGGSSNVVITYNNVSDNSGTFQTLAGIRIGSGVKNVTLGHNDVRIFNTSPVIDDQGAQFAQGPITWMFNQTNKTLLITNANSTTPTSLIGAGNGTLFITNSLPAGAQFLIDIEGEIATSGAPGNSGIMVQLGSTTIGTNIFVPTASLAWTVARPDRFRLRCNVTCLTNSASIGYAEVGGEITFPTAASGTSMATIPILPTETLFNIQAAFIDLRVGITNQVSTTAFRTRRATVQRILAP